MGESAAETVREIHEVRSDLEGKVRVLERRLPVAAVWMKRLVGIAVGGGAGSTVFWFVVRRVRRGRAAKKAAGHGRPRDGTTIVEFAVPGVPREALPWIYGAAAVWVVLRFSQLRETRRTNRLLAARAA